MSRNGSGTYSLPAGNPVVTGTTISSTWANNTLTDIANALTGSLSADGQTTASGNLNMGTNRIINVGDPSSAQDAATKYYVDQLIAALGTMAYQNASAVAITGGTVTNVTIDLRSMTNQVFLPVGPTALRTASPVNGLMRFNTDAGGFYEGYINGNWQKFVTVNQGSYTITYVVVGGGGGGTNGGFTGAGGAGQFTTSTMTAIPSNVFTVTIGAGGANNTNGNTTSITGVVNAIGGGAGGATGGNSGNGYSGGTSVGSNGGAGSSGNAAGNNGGPGTATLIAGGSVTLAGGGGGGDSGGNQGSGAAGGGTGGNGFTSTQQTNGSPNTGSGGGGSAFNVGQTGGSGGSGIAYLRMPTANYTGTFTGSPTVTTSGSDTVLRYNSSGTYTA